MLADINENAWKRRGTMSSHEEHTNRMEIEAKKVERGKVKDRIKKLEDLMKSAEEKKAERRKDFMVSWKEKKSRKRKKDLIQKGWKDLMECLATWEELQEDEMNYNNEDIEELFCEEWSEEGFKEAGNIMEDILSEVLAFSELHVRTYSRPMSASSPLMSNTENTR